VVVAGRFQNKSRPTGCNYYDYRRQFKFARIELLLIPENEIFLGDVVIAGASQKPGKEEFLKTDEVDESQLRPVI
jgi:hypothetical protein